MAEKFSPSLLIVTLAVTTLFFIVGILIGNAITSSKTQGITDLRESLRLEMLDMELQSKLFEQNPCTSHYIYTLGETLDDLGSRLTMLEDQLGKNDKQVIDLKKPYTELMIQHYLLIKKQVEKCNEKYIIILFFYSNNPDVVDDSKKQGYALNYLADKYGYEKVKVYSIDADLDLGIVNALTETYNVTMIPTTIVNDKVYSGYHTSDEVEEDFSFTS
jgi:hypothetical protein